MKTAIYSKKTKFLTYRAEPHKIITIKCKTLNIAKFAILTAEKLYKIKQQVIIL